VTSIDALAPPHPGAPYDPFDVVVVAASTGGLAAYSELIRALPADFPVALVAVQHRSPAFGDVLPRLLRSRTNLRVMTVTDGARLQPGALYVAPPERQVLFGHDRTLRLVAPRMGAFPLRRCTADDLFVSAAETYGDRTLAVVLTGEHDDGALGVRAIKRRGGRVLVQDQGSAQAFRMPSAAIATGCVDFVLPPNGIARALIAFTMVPGAAGFFAVPVAPWAVPSAPPALHKPRTVFDTL
jgi:two-component system chemotaxis response regulator CheB